MRFFRGKACKLAIPAHTFIDEQSVDSLQYVVYSMNHGKSSFLEATYPIMQGVALESGEFDFRLDARDSMKQVSILLIYPIKHINNFNIFRLHPRRSVLL